MPTIRVLIHLLIVRPLLHVLFGVTITGKENLRGLKQFVIAANHNSHLDTLLLYSALPPKALAKTCPVAARDYFARPRWFFAVVDRLLKPIWVNRDNKSGDPFGEMLSRIDSGHNIIIFPEGTRGKPGRLEGFRTGVGRLIEERPHVPVVPVFLHGPERSLPKSAPFPLPIWNHVAVGPPQLLNADAECATELVRESIQSLEKTHSKTRNRRKPTHDPAFTVAVLGIDGSGKSTLSRRIAETLSKSETTCLIGDKLEIYEHERPKAIQPLLTEITREWIGKQAKRAKSLAHYKIPKLTELLLRDRLRGLSNRWYQPDLIVMDGCPLLNMTAWATLYRDEFFNEEFCRRAIALMSSGSALGPRDRKLLKQFPEMAFLRRIGFDKLNIPDVVVFLDVAPDVAIGRINSRGEQKQVHETEEKLDQLRRAYLMVCRVLDERENSSVFQLDGTKELDAVLAEAVGHLDQVRLRQ